MDNVNATCSTMGKRFQDRHPRCYALTVLLLFSLLCDECEPGRYGPECEHECGSCNEPNGEVMFSLKPRTDSIRLTLLVCLFVVVRRRNWSFGWLQLCTDFHRIDVRSMPAWLLWVKLKCLGFRLQHLIKF